MKIQKSRVVDTDLIGQRVGKGSFQLQEILNTVSQVWHRHVTRTAVRSTKESDAMAVVHDVLEFGFLTRPYQGVLDNQTANAVGNEEEWPISLQGRTG